MADFGGFEVPTPQEVLARLNERRNAVNQIQDPQTRRVASAGMVIQNLFDGGRELSEAREIEKSMIEAQKKVDAMPPVEGDDVELRKERRRLNAMFDAVKEHNPQAAAQISEQLTMIEEEMFNRKRLRAQDTRAEETHGRNMTQKDIQIAASQRDEDLDNWIYIEEYDPKTGQKIGTKAYRYEDREAWSKAANKPNTVIRKRGEVDFDTADLGNFKPNGSTVATDRDMVLGNVTALRNANRVVEILKANEDAATEMSGLLNLTTEMANEARAGIRVIDANRAPAPSVNGKQGTWLGEPGTDGRGAAMQRIDEILSSVEGFGEEYARNKEAYMALTLNMAYSLARSLDPSGRLSDADVQFAAQMIARSRGNPRTITRVLAETLVGSAEMARMHKKAYRAEGVNPGVSEFIGPAMNAHDEIYEKFKNNVLSFPGLPAEEMYPIFGMEPPGINSTPSYVPPPAPGAEVPPGTEEEVNPYGETAF